MTTEFRIFIDFARADTPAMTGAQAEALVDIGGRYKATTVRAGNGGFGLDAETYIGFTIFEADRDNPGKEKVAICGGIDREGRVST